MQFLQGVVFCPHECLRLEEPPQQAARITNSNAGSSGKGSTMMQSSIAFARPVFSGVVLSKFETAVVDYVIGGGASLRAAGGLRFKRFVSSLTDGYEPPSTRTILRCISKLFRIALPMI
jgi:hypothetical protein